MYLHIAVSQFWPIILNYIYTVFRNKEPLIFIYNSRISWSIFIIFATMET